MLVVVPAPSVRLPLVICPPDCSNVPVPPIVCGAVKASVPRFGETVIGVPVTVPATAVLRQAWGLVGGRWSRFASFIYAPGTVLRYLRGQARPGEHLDVGHNPLGSLSVFALLGVLAVQLATGLVADDEIASVGPLNRFVSSALASSATGWHKNWGQYVVLGLVGLHIAAIVFYAVAKRQNLVGPMLGGDKPLPAGTPARCSRCSPTRCGNWPCIEPMPRLTLGSRK